MRDIEQVSVARGCKIPAGLDIYYRAEDRWYGENNGRHFELDIVDGKAAKRIVSLNERSSILAIAKEISSAEASRRSGIPAATIRKWLSREKAA